MTYSHVTQTQAHSPQKTEASPQVPAVERLKHRFRRRHRSSYDHKRHICRSVLEVVQVDSDDGKENVPKYQRQRCESRANEDFSPRRSGTLSEHQKKQVSKILGVYSQRWPATLTAVNRHVIRLLKFTVKHPIIDVFSIAELTITVSNHDQWPISCMRCPCKESCIWYFYSSSQSIQLP